MGGLVVVLIQRSLIICLSKTAKKNPCQIIDWLQSLTINVAQLKKIYIQKEIQMKKIKKRKKFCSPRLYIHKK